MYTWMGNSPSFVFIILLVLSVISFVFGLTFYILKIFKNKKIDQKYFWYIRVLSYVLTFILLIFLVDFVILDFVSRYNLVTKPTDKTSTYDTIIYFIREYDVNFVDGIKTTLKLALLGTVIGLVLAFLLVSLRILESSPRDNDLIRFIKKIGNTFANIYVTVIRGTPMIVQAFIFYYLVLGIVRPTMELNEYRDFLENVWTPFRAGLFTVSINTTAYLTEVLRGGIESLNKGQMEAARSLGMSRRKANIYIILPQAIKNSLPSICNEFSFMEIFSM